MVVVAAAIGGVGYLLVQQFISGGTTGGTTGTPVTPTVITEFGESILQDPRYQRLQDFGQPVRADLNEAGNPNPFR